MKIVMTKMVRFSDLLLFGCPFLEYTCILLRGVSMYEVITPLSFEAFAGAAFVLAALDII